MYLYEEAVGSIKKKKNIQYIWCIILDSIYIHVADYLR